LFASDVTAFRNARRRRSSEHVPPEPMGAEARASVVGHTGTPHHALGAGGASRIGTTVPRVAITPAPDTSLDSGLHSLAKRSHLSSRAPRGCRTR
jgi:hypothetical protein